MRQLQKSFLFIIGLVIIIVLINIILLPPKLGFYNDDYYDIVFFGTSESYCTFNPDVFEEYGLKSYNRGRPEQTLNHTYYYIKDAFSKCKIDKVVVEIHGIGYSENGEDSYWTNATQIGQSLQDMRESFIKYEDVLMTVPLEFKFDYLFPLSRYHDRWENVISNGVSFMEYVDEAHCGYREFTDSKSFDYIGEEQLNSGMRCLISDKNYEYLYKIKVLCEENGSELILVKGPLPCSEQDVGISNSISDWATENGVIFINFLQLKDAIGLDCNKDSLDGGMHLNKSGAEKVSRYMAEHF